MHHEEFIGKVQSRARLSSRGAAESATRATLETLGERIPSGLADNLAAQLPYEIGEHLRRVTAAVDVPDTGTRMSRHEFLDRVAHRENKDLPKAAHDARSVMEVIDEAVQGGVTDKVRRSLDAELGELLFAGSTGTTGHRANRTPARPG